MILEYAESKKHENDELREACFQALETLAFRCPTETQASLSQIIDLGLKYIKYDPNYDDDDDADEDEDDEEDEDEEDWR